MILIHKPRKGGLALIGANAIGDKTVLSTFLTYRDSHKTYATLRLRFIPIGSNTPPLAAKSSYGVAVFDTPPQAVGAIHLT